MSKRLHLYPHPSLRDTFPVDTGKENIFLSGLAPRRRGKLPEGLKGGIIVLIFLSFCFSADTDFYFNYKGSNKNFTYDTHSQLTRNPMTYNYNRLRTDLDFGWEDQITFKYIVDLENHFGKSYLNSNDFKFSKAIKYNIPLDPYHYIVSENTQSLRTYLYRGCSTIYLPNSTLVLGYQRIPLGVGRLWNPTDIVNPFNPLSIESEERLGAYGGLYTYNFGELLQFRTFETINRYSKQKDYGYTLKGNFSKWDAGVSYIANKDQKLSGIEIEREILDLGIEARTEFAHIESSLLEKKYQRYILGCDYAFPNSLYVIAEYLYNEIGETDKYDYELLAYDAFAWNPLAKQYGGFSLAYELSPLINISQSIIMNLGDGSAFFGTNLQWSLWENTDLVFGNTNYSGSKYSEFWHYQILNYFSISNYF